MAGSGASGDDVRASGIVAGSLIGGFLPSQWEGYGRPGWLPAPFDPARPVDFLVNPRPAPIPPPRINIPIADLTADIVNSTLEDYHPFGPPELYEPVGPFERYQPVGPFPQYAPAGPPLTPDDVYFDQLLRKGPRDDGEPGRLGRTKPPRPLNALYAEAAEALAKYQRQTQAASVIAFFFREGREELDAYLRGVRELRAVESGYSTPAEIKSEAIIRQRNLNNLTAELGKVHVQRQLAYARLQLAIAVYNASAAANGVKPITEADLLQGR